MSSQCSCFICIANFIKGKFEIKTEEVKDKLIIEEPVKIIEVKDTVKEGKAEAITELSNKLDNFVQKANEVYELGKEEKKIKRRKKRIIKLRSYLASIHLELGLYFYYLHLLELYKIQFQPEFFFYKLL